MKFLCGRPGCGKESTATLQIDAPSSTVSLVDPRISRDGVPLCPRHADATTPPLGWTMNDLRSRNRLSAVPDEDATITSTPPRVRPENESGAGPQMSRRQSIAERARVANPAADEADGPIPGEIDVVAEAAARHEAAAGTTARNEHRFKSSRPAPPAEEDEVASSEVDGDEDSGPASRPTRRRDVAEDDAEEEDKFPWHFQFDDDEPEELHASSPLLSRAFRSSIG